MSALATLNARLTTTLGRELIVAVTGLGLIGFILFHLSGNLLIIAGPDAFNAYANKLASLGPMMYIGRAGLIAMFSLHILAAISLARDARKARETRYAVNKYAGEKSPATRFMLYSGLTVFAFLLLHLTDFTLADHHGPTAFIGGEDFGLFGLVWNKFANPLWSLFYIVAVVAVGLHLSHAASSVFVTLGALTSKATPRADLVARILGGVVALGFASIPIYILIRTYITGGVV